MTAWALKRAVWVVLGCFLAAMAFVALAQYGIIWLVFQI